MLYNISQETFILSFEKPGFALKQLKALPMFHSHDSIQFRVVLDWSDRRLQVKSEERLQSYIETQPRTGIERGFPGILVLLAEESERSSESEGEQYTLRLATAQGYYEPDSYMGMLM